MKNAIVNQYDGPRAPAKRLAADRISLDYINSDDAAVIDAGIRETIKGVGLSIMAIGIGFARLKDKEMFMDLGCHSMSDYLEGLCDKMKMDRSTAHNWLYIGEAWLKYRRELEKIDFTDADGPYKLPYVEKALEIHEKKEVFRNVKEMSVRAFKDYSRGEMPEIPPSKIRVVGNSIYIGKKLAVTLADELDPKTRQHFEKVIVQAGEALEEGEILYTTRLYDQDELRKFERRADKLKKELRSSK